MMTERRRRGSACALRTDSENCGVRSANRVVIVRFIAPLPNDARSSRVSPLRRFQYGRPIGHPSVIQRNLLDALRLMRSSFVAGIHSARLLLARTDQNHLIAWTHKRGSRCL